jgi:DNA processing protein
MNWDAASAPKKTKPSISLAEFDESEQTVLKILIEKKAPVIIDELSWKSTIPVSQLAAVLLGLEFKGVIKSLPGKQYTLSTSTSSF